MAKKLEDHNYFGIDATIIADSKNELGNRLTTFILTFPRHILAEMNTHRVFSRNSASSRAIPFKKMLENVQKHPFIPIAWQKDHKGMQGTEYFTEQEVDDLGLETTWLVQRDIAVAGAQELNARGVTKQIVNRLLEPFLWHTAIVTTTDWENFFHLRCPQYLLYSENEPLYFRSKMDIYDYMKKVGDKPYLRDFEESTTTDWLKVNKGQGEIHIMALAEAMWDVKNESTPKQLRAGEWHIPFGDNIGSDKIIRRLGLVPHDHLDNEIEMIKIKIATARCARTSYLNFEGKDDYETDIRLHNQLSAMGHWSPFEHCAQALSKEDMKPINLIINRPEVNAQSMEMLRNEWLKFQESGSGVIITNKGDIEIKSLSETSGNFKGFIQYRKMFKGENKD